MVGQWCAGSHSPSGVPALAIECPLTPLTPAVGHVNNFAMAWQVAVTCITIGCVIAMPARDPDIPLDWVWRTEYNGTGIDDSNCACVRPAAERGGGCGRARRRLCARVCVRERVPATRGGLRRVTASFVASLRN